MRIFISHSIKNEKIVLKFAEFLESINSEIEDVTSLNAARLVEIYKKDQLKDGKLKEIASRLNEEDNPVIMLVKQKK